VYFYCTKIDRTVFIKVGSSLISLLSLTLFIYYHPSDVEPSYIPIFRSIQSAIYPVGRSTDRSLFTRMFITTKILVGSSQNLVLIFVFGCPTSLPNFSSIKACVSELERFLCLHIKK